MYGLNLENVVRTFFMNTYSQRQVTSTFVYRVQINQDIPITSHPLTC